jgi:hypothetical protein
VLERLCLSLTLIVALGACTKATPAADGGPTPTDGTTQTQGSDGSAGDAEEFCRLGAATFANGNPFQGFDPSDPAALRANFAAVTQLFTDLLAVAPVDVRVTIEGGVDAMVAIAARLDEVDFDISRLSRADTQRFQQLTSEFDFDAFAVAAEAHCG